MTLRGRLICALMAAALLPMAVAVGVMTLRAAKTAQQEAEARLEAARKQTLVLLDRHKNETVSRIERAAEDLARDPSALEPLRGTAIPAATVHMKTDFVTLPANVFMAVLLLT